MALNPYSDLPAGQFWRKAVTNVPPFALDPSPRDTFAISRADRVATAGSCFAQRVAEALREAGYNYYVTEAAPAGTGPAEAQGRQFGTFSARYGNLYYARQFIQLFDRAYGRFTPELTAWERPDGRLVDPFRPTIEPEGFDSVAAIEAARAAHFAEVRRLFETLDVFVITLGLTEGFRWRADGAALPLAPGVAGGTYDPAQYDFVNAGAGEVAADLRGFLDRLWGVNPGARVILTVSPVPMIATYLDRHVMVSNSYSKSVLRAAAGEVCGIDDPRLVYFPSYDLVTTNVNAGRYYNEDQRTVTDAGVRHVMRAFLNTFSRDAAGPAPARAAADISAEFEGTAGVICDEEQIERSLA
ncbi:GSCFA domain-containing protein [Methylobacterium planeticum]|uniref:GSCFA domain-containing protein n=1 Tax=Methylobacterium planeticum TaxID=2615211 RepID=A0A6N6MUB5_9HYPH|nr:GSCFA domain-containing protein [Methylobacterium planeticum]KAB1074699.1 GSCFA domain-containing protein [Methylobacterium planeticum]